jgi:hypothetical protein
MPGARGGVEDAPHLDRTESRDVTKHFPVIE